MDSQHSGVQLLVQRKLTLIQIRLNDKVRCIRDSAEWKDCPGGYQVDDLVRDIEQSYDQQHLNTTGNLKHLSRFSI